MDKIVITILRYFISFIDRMNLCDTRFFFCINWFFSIVITCMINEFCWIMTRWYFFTHIVFINDLIIDTNNWLCISFCFQSNECIKCTFGLNIDMRDFLIYYNIITFWCIQMIWSADFDVWVNSDTSTPLILVWNHPSFLLFWWLKH